MIAEIAERLCGEPACEIVAVRAGGNNELFRVATAGATFALKRYPAAADDTRERLGREFAALRFLWGGGERAIPEPVAIDPSSSSALYGWIPGARPAAFGEVEITAALAFLTRVHAARVRPAASALRVAVEACFDGPALIDQVEARLAGFAGVAGEPALQAFLAERFVPVWNRIAPGVRAWPALAPRERTLSPSDFGRHNTLVRPDGTPAFLDLEYFGWDDPVKLVADTLWHPGSAFAVDVRARIRAEAARIYGADPGFAGRLRALEPAYAARWALIVLAEFLPDRWARRRLAGDPGDWPAAKAAQLRKAEHYVADAEALSAAGPSV
jgi:hypothetical protein